MLRNVGKLEIPVAFLLMFFKGVLCQEVDLHGKCRMPGGQYYDAKTFEIYSCAKCYHHMDKRLFGNGTKLRLREMWLFDPATRTYHEASYENRSSPIFATFLTSKQEELWISCCQAAVRCCEIMMKNPPPSDPDMCPRTWDGWNCWPDTTAGTTQEVSCPSYIYFNSDVPQCKRYAKKRCLGNATWYHNYKRNEYSDYTTCGQGEDITLLLHTHIITFGISVVLIIPALIIFFAYRQLRVLRIFMHKNLFLSLLFTALSVVIFEGHFILNSVNNPNNILRSNQIGCKIFYTLTKYLRLSTYMWMFCEGFYLHKLIAAAFTEQKSTLIFWIIGWGSPIIPVGIWAAVRSQKADEQCWTVPSSYFEWIIYVPMLLALLVNFCFLVHIIQILIMKLRSTNTDEPAQFRRAVRATMVLIPLFGLHFLFVSYHPKEGDCHAILIYNIVTYSLDGLQGAIVSLLFCYFNNEVIYLVKRSYDRNKMMREISSHMSSRKSARDSRTSVSTNVESLTNEGLSRSLRKK